MNYNVQHGLAGTVVYSMYQDSEGFIWFATETGVSRFDGTHFKNFTSEDGLPANTIISIYGDSKGRVWLAPFKHAICYYYKGKIYNQQNDSLLKKITLNSFISGISEDKQHNILLTDGVSLYLINPQNEVSMISSNKEKRGFVGKISSSDSGFFYVLDTYELYKYDTKNFTYLSRLRSVNAGTEQVILHDNLFCWMVAINKVHIRSAGYKLDYDLAVPPVNSMYRVNDSVICLNTTKGALFLNILQRKTVNHFLPDKNVSNFLIDSEGGTWFSTFNDGVYRLHSEKFKIIKNMNARGRKMSVYDLQKAGDTILVGGDMGYLQMIVNKSIRYTSLSQQFNLPLNNPITSIKKRGDVLAMGCGMYIFLKTPTDSFISTFANPIKEIAFKSPDELMVAGSTSLYSVRIRDLKINDIWYGRTTSLLCRGDSVYFGTLHGLYLLKPDTTTFYFGDLHPSLRHHIAAIREGKDSTIWIATYGGGVTCLKNNRIIRKINKEDGLSSNTCRALAIDSNYLWVGTDKGLNRVNLNTNPVTIVKYSAADGLSADIINTVLIDGNTVYAGTPEGLSYFDKRNDVVISNCDLKLLAVHINGILADDNKLPELYYGKSNISIDFAAISFKAAGDIIYTYRLLGLDTSWQNTSNTSLEFISLPPGEYWLELFATNKFGKKSDVIRKKIIVHAPWWQTPWFISMEVMVIIFLTFLIVTWRNRIISRKAVAKRAFEKKLQELEQKALRAQMNPHFIFNCLHSVQEFIIDRDILSANKYLSSFSRLIRQTLDNSLQPMIPVADEIQYLTNYLNLEQLRFKHQFDYTITLNKNIIPAETFIPVMVLQPHVENAIRHGIQNKKNDKGFININFSKNEQVCICTITDNGIGREAAQTLKKARQPVYQSRGIQLTQQRIDIMNDNLPSKITLTISDIRDAAGAVTGTAVTILFPLVRHKKQESDNYD